MQDYDKKMKKIGPIDLLVLAIGQNGRLAFNEPKTSRRSKTHEQLLSNSTRRFLIQYFNEKVYVPMKSVTIGLDSIMRAKKIILIASGEQKSATLSVLVNRKYSKLWPATILNYHSNVSIFADIDACKLLMQ
jgi:glucosamine-6-phosphate deaminase